MGFISIGIWKWCGLCVMLLTVPPSLLQSDCNTKTNTHTNTAMAENEPQVQFKVSMTLKCTLHVNLTHVITFFVKKITTSKLCPYIINILHNCQWKLHYVTIHANALFRQHWDKWHSGYHYNCVTWNIKVQKTINLPKCKLFGLSVHLFKLSFPAHSWFW